VGSNSDIVFVGVKHVDLPITLVGVTIRNDVAADLEGVRQFNVESEGRAFRIAATSMKAYENALDIFDTGLEWP
jgi:hypothetical protein